MSEEENSVIVHLLCDLLDRTKPDKNSQINKYSNPLWNAYRQSIDLSIELRQLIDQKEINF